MFNQDNIGLLGGTFDPIHYAHIRIGEQAIKQLHLDQCLLIPNNVPPHRNQPKASNTDRAAMIELAIANKPKMALSTIELDRPGPSYMIDTLTEISQHAPNSHLTLIIGADSFNAFESWHRWQDIASIATIAVFQRPNHRINLESPLLKNGYSVEILEAKMNISATEIRHNLNSLNKINADDMPQKVIEYIESHGLYRN